MDPFVAEIRILACNFAPSGWAFCDGQILPITQNTALFSLLGTVYGGDGKSTFGLPDLRGMVPMSPGQGPGLTEHVLGERSGVESVSLLTTEIPAHTHQIGVQDNPLGTVTSGSQNTFARPASGNLYTTSSSNLAGMSPYTLAPTGGSLPHNNMQPYLTLNFCIAMQGVFPPRS